MVPRIDLKGDMVFATEIIDLQRLLSFRAASASTHSRLNLIDSCTDGIIEALRRLIEISGWGGAGMRSPRPT